MRMELNVSFGGETREEKKKESVCAASKLERKKESERDFCFPSLLQKILLLSFSILQARQNGTRAPTSQCLFSSGSRGFVRPLESSGCRSSYPERREQPFLARNAPRLERRRRRVRR